MTLNIKNTWKMSSILRMSRALYQESRVLTLSCYKFVQSGHTSLYRWLDFWEVWCTIPLIWVWHHFGLLSIVTLIYQPKKRKICLNLLNDVSNPLLDNQYSSPDITDLKFYAGFMCNMHRLYHIRVVDVKFLNIPG